MKQEPGNLLEQQCLEYFQEADIFRRLLRGFRDKYMSYNSFSGTVVLGNLTAGDRDALEGFLRRNYHGKKSASVSADLFARSLADSKFSSVTPVRLLELYFGQPMVGKREVQEQHRVEWEQMLYEIEVFAEQSGEIAYHWFLFRQEELSYVRQLDEEKICETQKELKTEIEILQELPVHYHRFEYLAVFSARLTGDPHAFDVDRRRGRLLKKLVKWYADEYYFKKTLETERSVLGPVAGRAIRNDEGVQQVFRSLADQRQYLCAGIIRDDVSNYAMLYNVLAYNRDGRLHRGMEGFSEENQMVSVPLSVVLQWDRIECPGKKLYVVENPTVFALLCTQNKEIALMCMNGQPRLSSLLVLDLAKKADTGIYYSGDLDPEGIMIAAKLKQYYQGEFHYWRMSLKDYRDSISSKELSEKRIRVLERLEDEEMRPVAEALQREKRAGYQENLQWETTQKWRDTYEISGSHF